MEFFDDMTNAEKFALVLSIAILCYLLYLYLNKPEQKKVLVRCPYEQKIKATPIEEINPSVDKKMMVMFHAPWCGHCRNMMPAWDEFTQNFDGYKGTRIVKVDGTQNPELAQLHGVKGFPTVKFCPNGVEDNNGTEFRGDRSVQGLAQFLQQQ